MAIQAHNIEHTWFTAQHSVANEFDTVIINFEYRLAELGIGEISAESSYDEPNFYEFSEYLFSKFELNRNNGWMSFPCVGSSMEIKPFD